MHMSGAMSGQAKTLKGDEEPWVDDVYDDLLEGLEAEEGHGAAVSPAGEAPCVAPRGAGVRWSPYSSPG